MGEMRGKHVAVLSSNPPLRETIERQLSEQEMEVIGIDPAQEHASWRLHTLQPDTVILDVGNQAFACYLTVAQIFRLSPSSRVVCLNPEDSTVTVFVNRLLMAAHFNDLLGAIRWEEQREKEA